MLLALFFAVAPARSAAPPAPAWLAPYDDVRAELVVDDVKDAASAAARLVAALPDADVKEAAGRVAAATDLPSARSAFADVSRLLVAKAAAGESAYTLPPSTPVFHCTMTKFWGYWLQDEGRIGNPYEGSAMPRCGSKSTLAEAAKAAAPPVSGTP